MGEIRNVGLKILGLPTDRTDWLEVTLIMASAPQSDLGHSLQIHDPLGSRNASNMISVHYSARIPKSNVDEVSIESNATAVEEYIEIAMQNAESASGISYDVSVDRSSVNTMTSELNSTWVAAVASASESAESNQVSSVSVDGSVPNASASWTLLALLGSIACIAAIQ